MFRRMTVALNISYRGTSLNYHTYTNPDGYESECLDFSIIVAVAAVLATLMITTATHGLTDLVFAQGSSKIWV